MSKCGINIVSRISSLKFLNKRSYATTVPIVRPLILGIETSCDDTGAAILDRNGTVLGESLHSQQSLHLRYGGIMPPYAQELHRQNIERVVSETFTKANLTPNDVDAIAVTNRPGLPMSLAVGVRYAKHLSRSYDRPFIPIHHMEAHALTARINNDIPFPFICLLASGGHCILALVKGVQEFYMLGETIDSSPGECFDKIARRLKIRHLPEYEWLNGGQAIERAGCKATNSNQFEFPLPMAKYKDCQFSFAGLKNNALRAIACCELEHNVAPGDIIPDYENFCAALLKASTKHICHRTQRAMEFCELQDFINDQTGRRLVFSGGVACNDFMFNALKEMCDTLGYQIWRPIKPHCMDNGLMIAWNGVERWLENEDSYRNINLDEVFVEPKCSLGKSLVNEVSNANQWAKISSLRQSGIKDQLQLQKISKGLTLHRVISQNRVRQSFATPKFY